MNIHFRLRRQGKSDPVIILQVFDSRFKDRKFMYSLQRHIKSGDWDKRKERAKLSPPSQANTALNKYIDSIEQATIEFFSAKHNSKSLNREDLKIHLRKSQVDDRKEQEEKLQRQSEFFSIWQNIVETTKTSAGASLSANTLKSKKQTLSLVRQFAIDKKFKPTLRNIDKEFYTSFTRYMELRGLSPNSLGKHIKEIKAFLREAEDRDLEVNQSYRKKSFRVIKVETDSTFLNETELRKILQLKLTPELDRHRDIFVMACFTGARNSDWHQIRPENVESQNDKELLRITQTKTGEKIYLPVHPVVRTLWAKYSSGMPNVITRNKIAEAIRTICKKAELGSVTIAGEKVEKWTTISTHTARRSFATNAYLSRALDVYQIMKCTGHRTEASFLKYLKLNGKDYAIQAAESEFFKPEAWLKIA